MTSRIVFESGIDYIKQLSKVKDFKLSVLIICSGRKRASLYKELHKELNFNKRIYFAAPKTIDDCFKFAGYQYQMLLIEPQFELSQDMIDFLECGLWMVVSEEEV